MRSIFEILDIPTDTPKEEVEILFREYLEKYNPERYENSPLKPIAVAKYKELMEAYEEFKRSLDSEPVALNHSNPHIFESSTLKGYRPGYYYRRNDGCCDDVCRCIGCLWVGDTCCECMGGDCISCM
ncbi:J domain-containing protein [Fervidobacterium sp.]